MGDKNEVVALIDELIRKRKYILFFMLVKAFRQGIVYGTKVRAPHATVLNLVWGSGPWIAIPRKVFEVTKTHALGLGMSGVIFTLVTQLLTTKVIWRAGDRGALKPWHSAVAGFLVGFYAWGDPTSAVHMQMMMYILPRLAVALYHIASEAVDFKGTKQHYRIYSGLLWATLMVLVNTKPQTLQISMRKSLEYIFSENGSFTGFNDLILRHVRR